MEIRHKSLNAKALVKSYGGRRVVDKVDLEVHPGEIVGLLGPNGAGKTTIFYMIVGLIDPEDGAVYLDSQPITDTPMYQRARMGVSYLPQEASVFRRLSVEENIKAVLELMPLSRITRKERSEELLEDLNITHIRSSKGFALSGGERRRVEIARALAASPSFILLDEPFAGIDPIVVHDIQNIIMRLKERGIGILLTDHNVREALQTADRAYIINEGKILESGTPDLIAASDQARSVYLGDSFKL
ncbi:MAG: LPS export ABC transporter ATP-binding protein [Nitrospinaceae bacterium]|nr:LPS export ABC transporter ATP-binding protein [Nitrospinaceae bacterium]MBT3434502.1 LPS export ABC transporter ATP-binding protein [Nitrospinaceae bacterium]MBT3823096.1 LPS export ABC transporter ATP-binding protein [Nitrospinaceae bacterium]MBT4093324.1 LPS export ABC transporter ATP-binding protein [Nitrospinaceae bacterium]MBT4432289.1 LPS export ABC transporter ATP-binding protein [Nitrospinaceae bacterium]